MTKLLDVVLEKLRTLPDEEQDQAAEVLMNVIARHEEPEELDAETRAAIREGLEQIERGEVVSEEEMDEFFRQFRA